MQMRTLRKDKVTLLEVLDSSIVQITLRSVSFSYFARVSVGYHPPLNNTITV